MAALMRCMGGVCMAPKPALGLRIRNRFVRTEKRKPPMISSSSSSSSEMDSINQKSGVNNEHVEGAQGLEQISCPSGLKPMLEGNDRNAGPKNGVMMRNVSELQYEKTTSKRPDGFHHVEGLQYEKARPDDKRVIRLLSLARSKKLREQQGKILLEGRRLISEALDAGASPVTIFFSTLERLQKLPVNKLAQASLLKVKLGDVRVWPELEAPVDMIAIFKRPDASQLSFCQEKLGKPVPLTLICDNLRDPGNLGATLRCAAAAGCHSVLLSTGCVDVWEPKVLRAALGAHFCLPIIPNLPWSEIRTRLPSNTTVHVAYNSSVTEPEPRGTPQQKKPGDYGWVSSRQISRKTYSDDDEEEEDKTGRTRQEQKEGPVLITQPYYTNWTGSHTAVVIGGETHGLSLEALRLAEETMGRRLSIPMVRGLDSLNAAMAASVMLFEGRRQLSER